MAIENTVAKEYKNKFNTAFRSLPEEVREHSRRIQYYSEELLKKCIELGYYSENPLTKNKSRSNNPTRRDQFDESNRHCAKDR